MKYTKELIPKIAEKLKLDNIPIDWSGVDFLLPIIEKIKEDGAIFIIKFDGERSNINDNGAYSVLIFGKPLGDLSINTDAETLDEGLTFVICKYAQTVWNIHLIDNE